jgi:hypothetical protein
VSEPERVLAQLARLDHDHASVELERDGPSRPQRGCARCQQTSVRPEPVTRGEHGVRRLAGELRPLGPQALRQVGEVREDEVESVRHALEQIGVQDLDSAGHGVAGDVRPRKTDGGRARVGRPDARGRRAQGEGDGDGARTRADIGDARRAVTKPLDGNVDQRLGCGTRSHHLARCGEEPDAAEGGLGHGACLPATSAFRLS